jgi:Protein of unknown function (DUF3119)
MTFTPSIATAETVVLKPSFRLPLGLTAIAATLLAFLSLWAAIPVFLFAIFLGVQAATLRLHFTHTALEIYRGQTQIRTFPYADWYHWEIYWPVLPILFYFREVNSIHFLPVLFDPVALGQCLGDRCPRKVEQN